MMDRFLLSFISVVVIAAVAAVGHADLSPQEYWKRVFPNTPIPNSIIEKLNLDVIDKKTGISVDVGKGGVHVDTGKGKPNGGTTIDVGKSGVNVDAGKGKPNGGTTVNVGNGGVNVTTGKGKPNGGTTISVERKAVEVSTGHGNTHVDVSKGGVNVSTGPKGKPVVVYVQPPGKSPFSYLYAATADQLHDDPNVALFFLEKDLHPSSKFNVQFLKANSGLNFLPRKAANSIPFSSSKISETLKYFSIDPNSKEAQAMMETQKQCEEPAIKREAKYCATSLESMIDFTTSKLGKKIKAISTEAHKEAPKQQYTIASRVQKLVSSKSVACHIEPYVHVVYYCHESSDTSTYLVSLVGEDKTKVDAVAVCHKDTSQWNPKHVAFLKLKVKPGSVPICHFIPEDHIVWVQN